MSKTRLLIAAMILIAAAAFLISLPGLADVSSAEGPDVGTIFTEDKITYEITGNGGGKLNKVTILTCDADLDELRIGDTVEHKWGSPAVTYTYDVTAIADDAFKDHTKITLVTLGKNVTSIGKNAFYGCINIEGSISASSVTSIGEKAFYKCLKIESVTMNKVTSIPTSAFERCSSLETVSAVKATTVGNYAFYKCPNLEVCFTTTATSIGNYAFRDCTKLISDCIPTTVQTIGVEAYRNCYGFEGDLDLTGCTALTSIGNTAFYNCNNITDLETPDSLLSIGSSAFDHCDNLVNVSIGSGLNTLGDNAFYNCGNMASYTVDPANTTFASDNKALCKIDTDSKYILINCPTKWHDADTFVIGSNVKEIANNAFYNCDLIKSVTIGSNVEKIGSGAFSDCSELTSVDIPASVTEIVGNPFSSCGKLAAINVAPENLYYGNDGSDGVLYQISGGNLSELITYPIAKTGTSYTINPTVTKIRSSGFSGNPYIENVTMTGVTTIQSYAFYNCPNLKGTDVGEGVYKLAVPATTIDQWAFYNCDALENVILNHNLATVYTNSFHACDNLVSFEMDQAIPDADDQYCTANGVLYKRNLTEDDITLFSCPYGLATTSTTPLVIPESITIAGGVTEHVKKIGGYAFYGCKELTHLKLATTVSYIDINAFIACNKLAFIDATGSPYYSNVGNILYSADKTTLVLCPGASAASEIVIDNACTTINSYAFNNCTNINIVRVPANVDTIGQYAFNGCNKVNTMYFESNPTHIGEGAFSMGTSDTPATVIVYGCSDDQFRDYVNQFTTIRYFHYMKYDLNGGTGTAPDSSAGETGDYFNLPALGTWTKTGYYPLGWCLNSDGTGSVYAFGNLYAYKSSDTTLYIKWVENEVKIVLSGNGDGSTNGQAYATYNSSAFSEELLKEFAHATRNGYTLNGYYTAATGGDMVISAATPAAFIAGVSGYTDADGKWINPTANEGTVTLYAQWTPIKYTVTFDKNEGAADGGATYTFDATTYDTGTFTGVTRTGYELLGYYTAATDGLKVINPDGTVVKGVTGYSDADGKWKYYDSTTLTLYAQWEIIDYDITYHLDGGTNHDDNPATYTYETATITLEDPTKTGYTFGGWFDNEGCTGTAITQIVLGSTGDKDLYAKWTLTVYNLTYNYDGGADDPDHPNETTYTYWTDESVTIQLQTPLKTGYTFVSWHTDSTFTVDNRVSHIAAKSTGDKTFYAEWKANSYTVRFDYGEGVYTEQSFTYDVAQNLNKNLATKDTFSFTGWATTNGGAKVYDDQQNVSNLTSTDGATFYLYPVWTQKGTYTAKFYDDEESPVQELTDLQISKIADQLYEMPDYGKGTSPTRKIVGWTTEPAGAGTFYSVGASVKMGESNVSYYALWESPDLISVTYDENGGSKSLVQIHVKKNEDFNLSYYDGTKTGYHFKGWKLNGTGETLAAGAVYHAGTENLTFVAVWEANTYTFVFKTNDSSESGTMSPQTYTYDNDPTKLSKNLFTKTGYKFIGWSTTKSGTTVTYTDEQELKNVTSVDQQNIDLYPVWEINKYTVTADLKGGSVAATPTGWTAELDGTYTKKFDYNTPWTTINADFGTMPTRTGYKEPAWSTTSGNLGADDATNTVTWTACTYTVTFDKQEGTGGSDSTSATYDAAMTTITAPTRTGYTFQGYYTQAAGQGTKYYNANGTSAKNWTETAVNTLYAYWTINQYTVTADLNSGTISSDPTGWTKVTVSKYTKKFDYNTAWSDIISDFTGTATLARTGYNTPVWDKTTGNLGAADATMKLSWTANTYTVTLDMKSGTGGSENVTATYDSDMPVATMPTRTGYTFGGYFTGENGTGTQYYNANGTSAKKWNLTSDTTLYAKWTANSYTVTLDRQSGTSGSTSITATYDAEMPAITLPSRTGYTFGGYFTQTGGEGTQYYNADGSSAKNWAEAANTTLYAKWTADEYTVSFTNTPSTSVTDNITATYDSALPSVTAPTLTGYTFLGYFTASTGGTKYYNADGTGAAIWKETSVNNLFAQWQANTYKVVFNKNSDKATKTMSDQSFTYDEAAKALSTNNFERVGYTFGGWAETADGAVKYADKAEVQNLTSDPNGTFNLYAVWTPNSYKIDLNGHGAADGFLYVTYDSNVITNKNLQFRDGYTLTGYYLTNDEPSTKIIAYDGTDVSLVPNIPNLTDASGNWIYAGVQTFHAKWTINYYIVTVDLNGGNVDPAPTGWDDLGSGIFTKKWEYDTLWSKIIEDFTTNKTATIKKTGYKNPVFSPSSGTLPSSDSTLYVNWTIEEYKVTAKLDCKGTMTGVTDWNKESEDVYWRMFEYDTPWAVIQATLPEPTSENYTFTNWDKTGKLGAGDDTMLAKWTPNIYTVVMDLSGGVVTGALGDWIKISDNNYVRNFPYGTTWTEITDVFPTYEKPGYTFVNWTYPVDEFHKDFQTIKANWLAGSYTVTFDSSGGTAPSFPSKVVTYGEQYGELPTATKGGFVFVGWFTDVGDLITSTSVVAISADHTLHASWYGDGTVHVNVPSGGPGYLVTPGPSKIYSGSDYVFQIRVTEGYTGTIVVTADGTHGEITYSGDLSNTQVTIKNVKTDIDTVTISGIVPKEYALTLKDGGSERQVIVSYNCLLPSGVDAPVKAGSVFCGYFSQENGQGEMYYNSSMETKKVWNVTSNGTAYAYWIAENMRTVTYDINGGNGSTPEAQYVLQGTEFMVSGSDATKKDYTFGGWSDGTRTYQPYDYVIMGAYDICLSAVWNYNKTSEDVETEFSGQAMDAYGNPYPQADIYIDGEYWTSTNINGEFYISGITKDIHSMMVVAVVGNKIVYDTTLLDLRDGRGEVDITIQNYSASSILEKAEGTNLSVAVENLNKEANSQYSGSDVIVRMTVDNSLKTIGEKGTVFKSITDTMNRPYYQIFNVSLSKTVGGTTVAIDKTTNVLKLAVKMNTANMKSVIVSDYIGGEVKSMTQIGLEDTPAANTYAVDDGWIYIYLDTSAPVAIGYEMVQKSFILELGIILTILIIITIISIYIWTTRKQKNE